MPVKKVTPVSLVEKIDAVIPFWSNILASLKPSKSPY